MNEDKLPFSILVVDDEAKNIQLLGNLLEDHGYDIEFAMNGKEALDWIDTRLFDLLLLDVMMPGMDGYEVCRKLKTNKKTRHIPIIFLTAKTEPEDIVKGFEAGASDYILKPFNHPELLARVKKEVELKVLRGFIPICANCKDIRDDKGKWDKIENYIQNHSLALFSHTLCPGCMEKLYGNEVWYSKLKNKKNID